MTTVTPQDGEVIVLGVEELRWIIGASQRLDDLILAAFVARRLLGSGSPPVLDVRRDERAGLSSP